jgi:SEC-C motif-containing protein
MSKKKLGNSNSGANPTSTVSEIIALFDRGEIETAKDMLESAYSKNPKDEDFLAVVAHLQKTYLGDSGSAPAKSLLRDALLQRSSDSNVKIVSTLMRLLALAGRDKEAIQLQENQLKLLEDQAAFLRAVARAKLENESEASSLVGRKEPCPCGSGKKFKRCCAK